MYNAFLLFLHLEENGYLYPIIKCIFSFYLFITDFLMCVWFCFLVFNEDTNKKVQYTRLSFTS